MNKEDATGLYNNNWLNSSYGETLLPHSPWHKIMISINTALAQEVRQLSPNSEVTSCIINHLGPRFVNEFLVNHETPHMKFGSQIENTEAQEQAKTWFKEKMDKIIRDFKLKNINIPHDNEELSPDMTEYVGFVHQVVYRGIDRELSKEEKKEKILHTQPFATESLITGPQSETLGNAVSCLLQKHPSQLQRVSKQLLGRQLPNTLRKLIWKIKIFQAERLTTADREAHIDKLKSDFLTVVQWGQKELGITKPVCSSVDGIIMHAVKEIYSMVPCFEDGTIRTVCVSMAIQALNILYVHSRMYEPHYALVLLPLIWTYAGYASEKAFPSSELSAMFYNLLQNCFPTRLQIFASADHVVTRLEQDDPILFRHISQAMQNNVAFDPREFLVNFTHHDKEKAMALSGSLQRILHQQDDDNDDVLQSNARTSHLLIFMRKWIGEGFVGVLDFPAILFVWDQFFLSNWNSVVIENVCLVLVELLRTKLLQADDYNSIKTVLFNHVYTLYTFDIQQGLVYLNNGGSLLDVSGLKQPSQIDVPSQEEEEEEEDTLSKESNSSMDATVDYVELGELWVERKPSDSIPEKLGNTESFHVYVDEVRFIPDGATVIKVTGRILNPLWKKPPSLDLLDLEAFATLNSPARCPQFHYRYTVRTPTVGLPHDSIILLRVYTLDVDSGEMVIIGNCVLDLYKQEDDEYFLNIGGHQMKLKHELPSTVYTFLESYTQLTNIPAVSLLVRVLPFSEDFIEPPGYSSGYYDSSACIPNGSERKLYNHYKQLQPYPPRVSEAIRDIREEELDNC